MAGSAIKRALNRKGYGNPVKGGALLTPTRQELDLLDNQSRQCLDAKQQTRCGGAGSRHRRRN